MDAWLPALSLAYATGCDFRELFKHVIFTDMLTALLILSVLFVAYTNGANANFKGVASLYGSGTTTLKQALYWGTFTTFIGSLVAVFVSHGLLKQFTGKGVVPIELVESPLFACAVALGAATTSFLATRFGFPVSTTHALVGALLGAGLSARPSEVAFSPLLVTFVLPLFLSPLLAIALGAIVYWTFRLCGLNMEKRSRTVDIVHFISAGGASFARGLNDAPKMAALFLVVPEIGPMVAILLVSIAIAVGGLLDAKNVAETLGKKVTDMTPSQGLVASVVTAGLVITASVRSMPVSTTHVSVGSLLGLGAATGQAKWKKAIEIMFAWISTVPCGAILAALFYGVLRMVWG